MLIFLFACVGSDPVVPADPPPVTAPAQPAVVGKTPAPDSPDATPAAVAPVPPPEPSRPRWQPVYPYVSQITAPEWPDPQIDPDQCGSLEDGGPVGKDGCVTADLKCGDRIIGHTVGGVERYDGRFYESKMCWPNLLDHNGGDERVYRLTMPAGEWRAWVTMYTPCADLTLAAVRHQSDTCPSEATAVRVCEMSPKPYETTERLELTTQTPAGRDPTWYLVVEGVKDEEGLFELVVQCHPGVGGSIPKP